MEISKESLDDVLMELYSSLEKFGSYNKGSRGSTVELLGLAIRISKPRTRLSRSEDRGKPFSALGELLWYIMGSDKLDFIKEYVPHYTQEAEENGTIYGAYGPRLLAMRGKVDQLQNLLRLLKEKPSSRRAVIQLFNAEDIADNYKEIPCTTTFQFHVREGRLHMSTTMRSNDAYKGLPHDVFCFTMLQEMVATHLNLGLGEYYHYAGSMHMYEADFENATAFREEGYQKPVEMPEMPVGAPFAALKILIDAEHNLRRGYKVDISALELNSYWADLLRLLQAYWASGNELEVLKIADDVEYSPFKNFILSRSNKKKRVYTSY